VREVEREREEIKFDRKRESVKERGGEKGLER